MSYIEVSLELRNKLEENCYRLLEKYAAQNPDPVRLTIDTVVDVLSSGINEHAPRVQVKNISKQIVELAGEWVKECAWYEKGNLLAGSEKERERQPEPMPDSVTPKAEPFDPPPRFTQENVRKSGGTMAGFKPRGPARTVDEVELKRVERKRLRDAEREGGTE